MHPKVNTRNFIFIIHQNLLLCFNLLFSWYWYIKLRPLWNLFLIDTEMRTGYEENGISIHTILLFELSIFFCCIKLLYIIYMYCFILFLSDFLLEQIYKFRFSCQLALYIQLLERFGVSIVTKNVFKTSSTSLLLCYIHVHSLIQGENKLVEFYPFSQISFCNSWSGQSQTICCNCLVI